MDQNVAHSSKRKTSDAFDARAKSIDQRVGESGGSAQAPGIFDINGVNFNKDLFVKKIMKVSHHMTRHLMVYV